MKAETYADPGRGMTLLPLDATHAMHSWAAVTFFFAAMGAMAFDMARLCSKFCLEKNGDRERLF